MITPEELQAIEDRFNDWGCSESDTNKLLTEVKRLSKVASDLYELSHVRIVVDPASKRGMIVAPEDHSAYCGFHAKEDRPELYEYLESKASHLRGAEEEQ